MNDALSAIADDARAAGGEADAAAQEFEAYADRIQALLKRADALAAYIIEHAQAETLSTHVEISFEPHAAAMIANMAEAYRQGREGPASDPATSAHQHPLRRAASHTT